MNADMKWLDNPEVFRVNQLEAHSDHCYYLDYSDMKKEKNPLFQSLNGQWYFSGSHCSDDCGVRYCIPDRVYNHGKGIL